jgi:uncharacterized protein (TIGR00297 family)
MVGLAVNVGCAGLAWTVRGVDRSGAVVGVALGTALFAFGGSAGFGLLLVFFVLGTAATRAGWARKSALGIAQAKKGRRGARHALANTSAGVLFAFLARATPYPSLFALALVAAFATAAADTVASEWGQAFGRRHYLVTTLKRVPAGTDGAVSLEGTAAGWVAAVIVAGFGVVTGLVSPTAAAVAVGGAMAGSLLESFLGALAGPKGDLDNEIANLVNTLAGGLFALAVAVATGM